VIFDKMVLPLIRKQSAPNDIFEIRAVDRRQFIGRQRPSPEECLLLQHSPCIGPGDDPFERGNLQTFSKPPL
jgi:hypothetical protein